MKQWIVGIVALLTVTNALANDTSASIAGGVVKYTLSDAISMDEEILTISPKAIDVAYTFTNTTDHDITSQVAFPLPPSPYTIGDTSSIYPLWDDLYHSYQLIQSVRKAILSGHSSQSIALGSMMEGRPFGDFKREINGMPYGYHMMARAKDTKGKDITALLIKNNIPLSSAYIGGFMDEGLLEADPQLKKKLKKLGLLSKKGEILWQLYIDYIWSQTFPANKSIKVTHSYTPHVGDYWIVGKPGIQSLADITFNHRDVDKNGVSEVKKMSDFCPKESDTAAILSAFKNRKKDEFITYRAREVRYILTTGANWRGPIKRFRLEIIPPSPTTLILCCFEGTFKKSPTGSYICELENFTPKQDLKILFVDPHNPEN